MEKIYMVAKGSISEYQHFTEFRKLKNFQASGSPSFIFKRDHVDKTHS